MSYKETLLGSQRLKNDVEQGSESQEPQVFPPQQVMNKIEVQVTKSPISLELLPHVNHFEDVNIKIKQAEFQENSLSPRRLKESSELLFQAMKFLEESKREYHIDEITKLQFQIERDQQEKSPHRDSNQKTANFSNLLDKRLEKSAENVIRDDMRKLNHLEKQLYIRKAMKSQIGQRQKHHLHKQPQNSIAEAPPFESIKLKNRKSHSKNNKSEARVSSTAALSTQAPTQKYEHAQFYATTNLLKIPNTIDSLMNRTITMSNGGTQNHSSLLFKEQRSQTKNCTPGGGLPLNIPRTVKDYSTRLGTTQSINMKKGEVQQRRHLQNRKHVISHSIAQMNQSSDTQFNQSTLFTKSDKHLGQQAHERAKTSLGMGRNQMLLNIENQLKQEGSVSTQSDKIGWAEIKGIPFNVFNSIEVDCTQDPLNITSEKLQLHASQLRSTVFTRRSDKPQESQRLNSSLPLKQSDYAGNIQLGADLWVKLKDKPVYDKIKQKLVTLPNVLFQTSVQKNGNTSCPNNNSVQDGSFQEPQQQLDLCDHHQLQPHQYTQQPQQSTMAGNSKDQSILRKLESELKKLKETRIEQQLNNEALAKPTAILEQEKFNKVLFDQQIECLTSIASIFWQVPHAKTILNSVADQLKYLFGKRSGELSLLIQTGESQLQVIQQELKKQRQLNRQLLDYVADDHLFREKVLEQNNGYLKKMIEEYVALPKMKSLSVKIDPQHYSGLNKEMDNVRKALENGQAFLETLWTSNPVQMRGTSSLAREMDHEINCRDEQVVKETAKKVLQRFYRHTEVVDAEVQTLPDQLNYLKEYYQSQIERLVGEKIELSVSLTKQTDVNKLLQARTKTLEKKNEQLFQTIRESNERIEKVDQKEKYFKDQIAIKDKEMRSLHMERNDIKHKFQNIESQLQERTAALQIAQKKNNELMEEMQKVQDALKRQQEYKIKAEERLQAEIDRLHEEYKELERKYQVQMKELIDLRKNNGGVAGRKRAKYQDNDQDGDKKVVEKWMTRDHGPTEFDFSIFSDQQFGQIVFALQIDDKLVFSDEMKKHFSVKLGKWKVASGVEDVKIQLITDVLWASYVQRLESIQHYEKLDKKEVKSVFHEQLQSMQAKYEAQIAKLKQKTVERVVVQQTQKSSEVIKPQTKDSAMQTDRIYMSTQQPSSFHNSQRQNDKNMDPSQDTVFIKCTKCDEDVPILQKDHIRALNLKDEDKLLKFYEASLKGSQRRRVYDNILKYVQSKVTSDKFKDQDYLEGHSKEETPIFDESLIELRDGIIYIKGKAYKQIADEQYLRKIQDKKHKQQDSVDVETQDQLSSMRSQSRISARFTKEELEQHKFDRMKIAFNVEKTGSSLIKGEKKSNKIMDKITKPVINQTSKEYKISVKRRHNNSESSSSINSDDISRESYTQISRFQKVKVKNKSVQTANLGITEIFQLIQNKKSSWQILQSSARNFNSSVEQNKNGAMISNPVIMNQFLDDHLVKIEQSKVHKANWQQFRAKSVQRYAPGLNKSKRFEPVLQKKNKNRTTSVQETSQNNNSIMTKSLEQKIQDLNNFEAQIQNNIDQNEHESPANQSLEFQQSSMVFDPTLITLGEEQVLEHSKYPNQQSLF